MNPPPPPPSLPRLAVLCDFPEEGWASMDLCAEMVLAGLNPDIQGTRIRPPYHRPFERLSPLGRRARNADRLLNRLWNYPRYVRHLHDRFDAFHVVDHSYAQLIHELPPERTGVYCHDLDTFRCLLQPDQERRPRWFRAMARRILRGMQRAHVVFYSTAAIRRQIERHALIDPQRLVWAPLGPAPEFVPHPLSRELEHDFNSDLLAILRPKYLLHVGSCIPRKRIDVLLDVFAAVRQGDPQVQLVQVGGEWTPEQRDQIQRLGIAAHLVQRRGLNRRLIAALYRHAAVVLQTSDAEGFGLPLIEALACGAAVVASDIPVLREVGGDAAVYCPVAQVPMWTRQVQTLLHDPRAAPSPALRQQQAQQYSWNNHCRIVRQTYRQLIGA